jgi:hypothetical protein
VSSSITYTAVLDVRRATADHLAKLLRGHRERIGTRRGTRALGVFRQAVLVLRWFVDGTRLAQLARDNDILVPTAYRYLHEGLTVLAGPPQVRAVATRSVRMTVPSRLRWVYPAAAARSSAVDRSGAWSASTVRPSWR